MIKKSQFLQLLLSVFIWAWPTSQPISPIAKEIRELKDSDVDLHQFMHIKDPLLKILYTQADNIDIAFKKKGIFSYFFFTLFPMLPLLSGENGNLMHLPAYKTPQLNTILNELCRKLNLPRPEVYLLTDDAQCYNFFTTSLTPKNAILILSDKLLNLLSVDEVKTALAHELTHIHHYDALKKTAINLAQVSAMGIIAAWFLATEGIHLKTKHTKYIIAALSILAITITADLLYTQFCERRANISAIDLTQEDSFVSMINKIDGAHQQEYERGYKQLLKKLDSLEEKHPAHAWALKAIAYIDNQFRSLIGGSSAESSSDA